MRKRKPRDQSTANHAQNVTGNVVQAGRIGSVYVHHAPTQVARAAAAVVTRVRPEATAGEVFVGRSDEMERVLSALDPGDAVGAGASGVVVSAVAGMGGVGKTALARHAAVEAARRGWFAGGVFWVDLQGYSPDGQVSATAVFGPLLRRLGMPDERIPDDPGEQAAVYDEVLTELAVRDRGVLVVLDNASAAAQVRGLLPGAGPHRIVVTTRDTLDLPHARRLSLDVLALGAAVALLERALHEQDPDDDRIGTDPPGAGKLAQACGGLPLALRIAAALLADEPHLGPGELAEQLRQAPGVEGYAHGEQALAATFDLSWRRLVHLHPGWARLLRLLCLDSGPDTSTEVAAALADQSTAHVRVGLRALRHAHLIRVVGPERWGLHDLIRAHTGTRHAPDLDHEQLRTAEMRLLDHYTTTTEHANVHLQALAGQSVPDRFAARQEVLEWLDAERATLIATVVHAATAGYHAHAVRLGIALGEYLRLRRYLTDLITVAEHAHTSAAHLTPHRSATTANNLGAALRQVQRFEEAITFYETALRLLKEAGDRRGEATTWNNLGTVLQEIGQLEESVAAYGTALDLMRKVGDRQGEAVAWTSMGVVLWRMGRSGEAVTAHETALGLFRQMGDLHGEANALGSLGVALVEVGRLEESVTAYQTALGLSREMGDPRYEANAWGTLGLALRKAGRFEEAGRCWERARDAFSATGDTDNVDLVDSFLHDLPGHPDKGALPE
ncbi:tetratricopeptide repeat protein [Saccharothrix deserti]|uniref:tetratricopeptide repeat protein n=1 Tax=Saccharothrix deserti TaxID=2593674 RepID=UPI00131EAAA5|nr:tetratricopeptide repeat protein [Saccharothrix deserti]